MRQRMSRTRSRIFHRRTAHANDTADGYAAIPEVLYGPFRTVLDPALRVPPSMNTPAEHDRSTIHSADDISLGFYFRGPIAKRALRYKRGQNLADLRITPIFKPYILHEPRP